MLSKDKMLGRLSDWSTLVVLAGIAALPLLPGQRSDHAPAKMQARVATRATATRPIAPKTTAPAPTAPAGATVADATSRADAASKDPVPTQEPAAAAASPTAAPVPDVWTEAEQAAGLRECLRLLAPVAAEVELDEPMKHGQCGSPAPVLLHSVGSTAKVTFDPAPELNCRLAAELTHWVEAVLQPAAREVLGSRITRIVGASAYACRNMYSNPKLPLSEHATGSAVDIAGFVTEDGRKITVLKAWGPTERDIAAAQKKSADVAKADAKKTKDSKDSETANDDIAAGEGKARKSAKEDAKVHKAGFKVDARAGSQVVATAAPLTAARTSESAFLRRLHSGACTMFGTVLGPEANEAHRNHFHFDVKERKRRGICH